MFTLVYTIIIFYEDGKIYQGRIESQKDIDRIPKKYYEAIRIFYPNKRYSAVLYGYDFIYLSYTNGYLNYAKWTPPINSIELIQMKGVGKEQKLIISVDKIAPTLEGKMMDDEKYEKIRQRCHDWVIE